MPLDSAWSTRSLILVFVRSTRDRCFAILEIHEQTNNRPGLIAIQLISSWFLVYLESIWGVVVTNESWLAAAELGAHPPAILHMVAASKHKEKEKAVEGAACSACWIWRQLCVGLEQIILRRNSKGEGPRIEDDLDVLLS